MNHKTEKNLLLAIAEHIIYKRVFATNVLLGLRRMKTRKAKMIDRPLWCLSVASNTVFSTASPEDRGA